MSNEQFEREMRYRTVMAVARTILTRGLITRGEYDDFDRNMIEKHKPFFRCIMDQTSVDKVCTQR